MSKFYEHVHTINCAKVIFFLCAVASEVNFLYLRRRYRKEVRDTNRGSRAEKRMMFNSQSSYSLHRNGYSSHLLLVY